MKEKSIGRVFALVAALLLANNVHALPLTYSFDTLPADGAIAGTAGQLIGWGYTLTNQDSSNWFMATELSASSFTVGTPDGSFFDFPILAPGQNLSASFDPLLFTGLYGITLGSFATPGQQDIGTFTLAGEWWTGDPLAGGAFLQMVDMSFADFSVSVIDNVVVPIPAPATLLLFGTGLIILRLFGKRARKKFY